MRICIEIILKKNVCQILFFFWEIDGDMYKLMNMSKKKRHQL